MTDEKRETFADRVWLAYWSLPRVRPPKRVGGVPRPESIDRLEGKFEISNGTIGRILSGKRKEVMSDTLPKLAEALNVSPTWLATGHGRPPKPSGPFPTRDQQGSAGVEESAGHPTLKPAISPDVQRAVSAAVDRALHEAPADARPHQVLALALMHVSMAAASK